MFEPATYAQTRLRRARPGPDDQRGFTLIELLVVIIILGILSAVVVFAVRGAGDKGQAASVSTDEKTIRTAEESYCAQNGKYASGDQLVAGKFLSDLPQYHQVNAQPTGGTCNGWKFFINRTAQAGAYPPGRWETIASSAIAYTTFVTRLGDGRVLAGGVDDTFDNWIAQIWDPTTGAWTSQDPLPGAGVYSHREGNTAILLSDDPGTPQSECTNGIVDNCGKVFVQGNLLFNPKAAPGSQWETLPESPGCNICRPSFYDGFFTYVQLTSKNGLCGAACGKIFIWASDFLGHPNDDIFDPRDNSFTKLPFSSDPAVQQVVSTVTNDYATQLPDGRIFLCCNAGSGSLPPGSAFLNPTSLAYSPGPAPPEKWDRQTDGQPAPVLPNGDIFFARSTTVGNPSGTYRPQAGLPGQFGPTISCPAAPSSLCRSIGSLPDGRVLVLRDGSGVTFVYNPATRTIDPGANLNNADSFQYSALLLDPAGGPCGAFCGKMLVVGMSSAEVYTA